MKQDSIIEELHQIREDYARKFNFDTNAICKDIQEKQAASKREIVSFSPRKPIHLAQDATAISRIALNG